MNPTTRELLAVSVGLMQTALTKWGRGASASDTLRLIEAAERSLVEAKHRLRIHMGD